LDFSQAELLGEADLIDDLPFLDVSDPGGVEPVGEAVGRACCLVANEGGCEVLWDARPLALGGEPLSGGVEHEPRTLEPETFPISRKQLHDSIDRKVREKGTRFRQDRQQMAFQQPMER
jgi:hypothetical protein